MNNHKMLSAILNALPCSSIIVDKNRKIILSNNAFLDRTGKKTVQGIIGLMPGQAINCKNLNAKTGECGVSETCRFCGILQAITKAQVINNKVVEEARVVVRKDEHTADYDLKITVSPIGYEGNELMLITLIDISAEKRKKALERIFFHDVLNKTGSLQGIAQLLNQNPAKEEQQELISYFNMISHELNEEILTQRQLMAAENDELTINITSVEPITVINQVSQQLKQHSIAENKNIQTGPDNFNITFNTDALLLKRILINMLKNALEASEKGETVTISCKKGDKNTIIFSVHNSAYIPEDIQLQIFHRSFSTKSSNRGLGTYSMKLLGERYLNGKVFFTSTKKDGATFYFQLPV